MSARQEPSVLQPSGTGELAGAAGGLPATAEMDTQPPPVTHAAVAFAVAAAQRADQLSSRSMDLLERADTLLASSARRLDPS